MKTENILLVGQNCTFLFVLQCQLEPQNRR